ncbi:MAG TPA: family 16 glycoside hydrolase [Verrucomicrobiae bacterium]|nr:family 16 glycoside hydrolase [Verrucomicrobiae bacterium]
MKTASLNDSSRWTAPRCRWSMCLSVLWLGAAFPSVADAAPPAEVKVSVRTDVVANTVDKLVYGHFFEHIYHSANNGLWGDVVWNRSFEQDRENAMGSPGWTTRGEIISYDGAEPQSRLLGGFEFRDLDYTVEVRKTAGEGGVRVLFRGSAALTLGAESNSVHVLEVLPLRGRGQGGGDSRPVALAEPVQGAFAPDKWHKVRVRVEDQRVEAWLDGKRIFDVQPTNGGPSRIRSAGWIGVGVAGAKAQFRNFLVKGLDGTVFWNRPLAANVPGTIVERWSVTGGKARVVDTPGEALNDARCLELSGTGRTISGSRILI